MAGTQSSHNHTNNKTMSNQALALVVDRFRSSDERNDELTGVALIKRDYVELAESVEQYRLYDSQSVDEALRFLEIASMFHVKAKIAEQRAVQKNV